MIVGISGLIGSGKDTIADYLVNSHWFKRESFAGTLKDAVSSVFGWDRILLEGKTPEARKWREQIDTWWAIRLNIPHLTPRWILQYWGTEVCRHGFHDDIWIASLENKIRNTQDDIVISDVRFINEATAIRNQGGICIRVMRGPEPEWMPYAITYMNSASSDSKEFLDEQKVHASEYSWAAVHFDYVLHNNSDLAHLYRQIKNLIKYHYNPPTHTFLEIKNK